VQQRRKEILTILEAFDLPQMNPNCVERPDSTVASQALHLLNNPMVRALSIQFAQRVESEVGHDRYRQIMQVYRTALSREPTSHEKQLALTTLEKLTSVFAQRERSPGEESLAVEDGLKPETRALAALCHVMMNSAEFLFVD